MNPINLKKFTYIESLKAIVAEASELGYKPGVIPGEQVFPDSCDYGLAVESPKTGRIIRFLFEERDDEKFIYKPYKRDNSPVKELIIYND